DGHRGPRSGEDPRTEALHVGAGGEDAALGGDEVREGKRGAEVRGDRRAVEARAEYPELGHGRPVGHGADAAEGMPLRELAPEIAEEIADLRGEMLDAERARTVGERARRPLIAPRGAPDAQVDASGVERLQHAEVLRDLEGAVVAQHHPAGTDPDARG